jgi:hypothetical protein
MIPRLKIQESEVYVTGDVSAISIEVEYPDHDMIEHDMMYVMYESSEPSAGGVTPTEATDFASALVRLSHEMNRTLYFICGEQAVKTYHHVSLMEDLTDDQFAIMVDYGYLDSINLSELNTIEDIISELISVHEGNFEVTQITENEYNYLKERGMK